MLPEATSQFQVRPVEKSQVPAYARIEEAVRGIDGQTVIAGVLEDQGVRSFIFRLKRGERECQVEFGKDQLRDSKTEQGWKQQEGGVLSKLRSAIRYQ